MRTASFTPAPGLGSDPSLLNFVASLVSALAGLGSNSTAAAVLADEVQRLRTSPGALS